MRPDTLYRSVAEPVGRQELPVGTAGVFRPAELSARWPGCRLASSGERSLASRSQAVNGQEMVRLGAGTDGPTVASAALASFA